MRFWTNAAQASEVEFFCDFWRQRPDGGWEQAAFAEQKATWVRLVGHGQVVAEPFPLELKAFIDRMGPRGREEHPPRSLPQSLSHLQENVPAITSAGPNRAPRLLTKTFSTTLEESNLVGNVYFANYFAWQRKARDLFLHAISPEYHKGVGGLGEMVCLRSRMDYLREAMPFDDVQVQMSLEGMNEKGAVFGFEFFRVLPHGQRQKLSVGRQEVVWVTRDMSGRPVATAWPDDVRTALFREKPLEMTSQKGIREDSSALNVATT
jgi:acyl-CoA thioesterase FadM